MKEWHKKKPIITKRAELHPKKSPSKTKSILKTIARGAGIIGSAIVSGAKKYGTEKNLARIGEFGYRAGESSRGFFDVGFGSEPPSRRKKKRR